MSPLHEAARAGHTKKVQDLLTRGYGPDDEDRNGHTALHCACIAGDLPTIKVLVGAGASLTARAQGRWCGGVTGLHFAAEHGHAGALRFLVRHGLDVHVRDAERYSALHYAAENNHLDAMEALLGAGADADATDRFKKTPLHYAAESGARDAIGCLVRARGSVNAADHRDKTPLMYAAESGDAEVMELLLRHGAGTEFKAKGDWCNGVNVLHLAAEQGHLMVCRLLVQRGVSIDVRDDGLYTPLHYAAEAGHQVCSWNQAHSSRHLQEWTVSMAFTKLGLPLEGVQPFLGSR